MSTFWRGSSSSVGCLMTLIGVVNAFHTTPAFFLYPQQDNNNNRFRDVVVRTEGSAHRSSRTSRSSLNVSNLGWDNEDFLNSLGQGPDAIARANEEYESISRFVRKSSDDNDDNAETEEEIPVNPIPDATLSPERISAIKKRNEEDHNEGGEMFKKLLERAEQQARRSPPPPPPPQPVATPGGPSGLPDNFASLSVEQQAALFRELMFNKNNPLPQQSVYIQSPDILPVSPSEVVGKGGKGDDRRFGRNRDADAVVNTSDVYLQQLKLDSRSRNLARYSGDEEFANKVFADPAIQEIKLHVNPYIEEQKRAERELYGAGTIDETLLKTLTEETRSPKMEESYAGIKYKEKLLEKKQRLSGKRQETPFPSQQIDATSSTESSVVTPSPQPPAQPPAQQYPSVAALDEEVISDSEPAMQTQQRTTAQTTVSSFTQPTPMQRSISSTVPGSPMRSDVSNESKTSTIPDAPMKIGTSNINESIKMPPSAEDFRRDTRTLMGLLLKHRGGPGFGLGRIQGAEIQRFIGLSQSVVDALKMEEPITLTEEISSANDDVPTPNQFPSPPSSPAVVSMKNDNLSQFSETRGAISFQASRVPVSDRLNSMISCLEGAVQMYKFSPPELQEGIVITLRGALLAAVSTCNDIIPETELISYERKPSTPRGIGVDPLTTTIGYIEGTIQMYKYSPPELQKSLLPTLRVALLSAINTCNEVIAGNEVTNFETYRRTVAVSPKQSQPQFTEAIMADDEESIDAPVTQQSFSSQKLHTGHDENSQFLESVYSKLKSISGDGKFGLKDNITNTEAKEVANAIAEMRSILVQELDSGIPKKQESTNTLSSSGTSKYQEMLAKARAEKDESRNM